MIEKFKKKSHGPIGRGPMTKSLCLNSNQSPGIYSASSKSPILIPMTIILVKIGHGHMGMFHHLATLFHGIFVIRSGYKEQVSTVY